MNKTGRVRMANRVEISVLLGNGRRWNAAWTTPRDFGRCFGAARAWARRDMSVEKVKGRSDIVAATVRVERTNIQWKAAKA